MLLIPAIDIKGGKCVRLAQGAMDTSKVYHENPIDVALQWQEQGAQRVHIVDLDGAFEGKIKNMPVIRNLLRSIKMDTELGGGLRNENMVAEAFNLGVKKVIIGTAAFMDKAFLKKMFALYQDKVLVAIDAKDGYVQSRGWTQALNVRAVDAAKELEAMGATGLVCTDIKADGMLKGPNIPYTAEIMKAVKIPVIASGGVSSLADLKALAALKPFGVIVGKALYEGFFTLPEALKVCSQSA